MGNSEYGFLIKSGDDFKRILEIIKQHNEYTGEEEVGEELVVSSILKFKSISKAKNPKVPSGLYLLAHNGGGRNCTMLFLFKRMNPRHILPPFEKPKNWMECNDFLWQRKSDEYDVESICKDIQNYQN